MYEKIGYKRTDKLEKINDKIKLVFYEKSRISPCGNKNCSKGDV